MRPNLEHLIDQIAASPDGRASALTRLGMLLEWTNRPRGSYKFYKNLIGEELMQASVSEPEQREIVRRLEPLLIKNPGVCSIPNVIASAIPSIALESLLSLIAQSWEMFPDDTRSQCVVGIRDNLVYGEDDKPLPALRDIVRRSDPRTFIRSALSSRHEQLLRHAVDTLPGVEDYISGRSRREP